MSKQSVILFLSTFIFFACSVPQDNCPKGTCDDEYQSTESLSALGEPCKTGLQCSTRECNAGICTACADGSKNGTETDVDCGGSCLGACAIGKVCSIAKDCVSGQCVAGACVALSTCSNGRLDGNESDVDCGGTGCAGCAEQKKCTYHEDCATGTCSIGKCTVPTCNDRLLNQGETDVDCGGPCNKCVDGKVCKSATDCTYSNCMKGVCVSCVDGTKNGTETGVDCGGSCPKKCLDNSGCTSSKDCVSNSCENGACASCRDGRKTGTETDVDCGGACSNKCSTGAACIAASDCASGKCQNGRCATSPCSNGVKDGSETGIDCGGSCLAKCQEGSSCKSDSDCATNICSSNACRNCRTNGKLDGLETAVDCGRECVIRCEAGQACLTTTDCEQGLVCFGVCQPNCGFKRGFCSLDATCLQTVGGRNCTCKQGYTGDGTKCVDVNECASPTACSPDATCSNYTPSFACTCKPGYQGNGKTCADVNECQTQNGGCAQACVNDVGTFHCECGVGFELALDGHSCEARTEWSNWPAVSNVNDPMNFSISGGVITDLRTGLHWQQSVSGSVMSYKNATAYCAGLGVAGGGWRIPTVIELMSLAPFPLSVFPTQADWWWTSTIYAPRPSEKWLVSIRGSGDYIGNGHNEEQANHYAVRCVR